MISWVLRTFTGVLRASAPAQPPQLAERSGAVSGSFLTVRVVLNSSFGACSDLCAALLSQTGGATWPTLANEPPPGLSGLQERVTHMTVRPETANVTLYNGASSQSCSVHLRPGAAWRTAGRRRGVCAVRYSIITLKDPSSLILHRSTHCPEG